MKGGEKLFSSKARRCDAFHIRDPTPREESAKTEKEKQYIFIYFTTRKILTEK